MTRTRNAVPLRPFLAILLPPLLIALAAAAPAEAQRSIAIGQTVDGRLAPTDPRLGDGSHFHEYVYRGRPGDRIVVTLRSNEFDAFLVWGRMQDGRFETLEMDDDGGGGTDARLEVAVEGGTYAIRVNSFQAGETGAYTLGVQASTAPPPTAGPPGSRSIAVGQTLIGRLTMTDPKLGDGSNYHTYLYQGRAGEELVISLASNEFDTFLRFGRMEGGRYEHLAFDDDGGGGTNSRLEVTLDRTGTYAIQANSFAAGQSGQYTLVVRRPASAAPDVPIISRGQTLRGRLDRGDPMLTDGSYYRFYVYRGTAGERIRVTLRSRDFDAFLQGGRIEDGQFRAEDRDDDSGGGTDAEFVATVGQGGIYIIQANSLSAGETGEFTLTVEPATAAPRPAPAASGRRIGVGQTVRGRLAVGDRMLSDTSYFHEYLYQGTPGDRIEISLSSTDFDAFLRWGRLDGTRFVQEAFDDDGGGGTDARLVVTVGAAGTYAIHANSFAPRTVGEYTLTIRPAPVIATPATTTETGRDGGTALGKWIHAYIEPQQPRHRPLGTRMQESRALESVVEGLNQNFPLPRNVDVRMDQCGQVNAFYNPRLARIVFCYELLEHLASTFARGATEWSAEQRESIEGAFSFIMMHEVGHALVHQLDLPITGREEDAVDQLAALIMIGAGDKGARAALAGTMALQPERGAVYDNSDFAGEHSLGPVRLYNVMCWIYGSDPQKYAWLVSGGSLPRERGVRCPGEYERMSKAWQRILEPHMTRP